MLMTEVIANGIAGCESMHSKEAAPDAMGLVTICMLLCLHKRTDQATPRPFHTPLPTITVGRCHL